MTSPLAGINRHYWITLYERQNPSNQVRMLPGDTPPTPSAGGGGYQSISLPKRSAVTSWQGRSTLLTHSLPVILIADELESFSTRPSQLPGFAYNVRFGIPGPIQVAINRLQLMWRPVDDTVPPPVLKLKASHSLVPYSRRPFVLNDVQWGDAQADETGTRWLQKLVLVLMEYRADEELQTQNTKKPRAHKTVHKVRHGETLAGIASAYGVSWRDIAQAQHPVITDPRAIQVGQQLSIPQPTSLTAS